jgi:hypothetical protein
MAARESGPYPILRRKRASAPLAATVLPVIILAVAGLAAASLKLRARRRWSRVKASGGRKSFVLNILERS